MIGFNPYSLNTHQLQQSLAFAHIQAGNAHFQQAGALLNSFQPQMPCHPFSANQMPPHVGCMPPPGPEFSNAPAGKGLTKNKTDQSQRPAVTPSNQKEEVMPGISPDPTASS